jgi:hypothetical protein
MPEDRSQSQSSGVTRSPARRWLREPLVHFILIGAAIYGVYALWSEPTVEHSANRIVVTQGEIEWLLNIWEKRWQRPPTDEELVGLIRDHVHETVMYREALAMGLDRNDVIVRRRMRQKLEFLTQDLATMTPPTDEELVAHFQANVSRYGEPDRITISQLFFNSDLRGDATLRDLENARKQLRSLDDPSTGVRLELGDRLLQPHYADASEVDLQRLFGYDFAEAVSKLTDGEWHGPVESDYGVHLVYVHRRTEAPPPDFEEVRDEVLRDWQEVKRREANRQYINALMDKYEVIIEGDDANTYGAAAAEPKR